MDAKLNQSDLISLLAKESNISVAKAELFTKSFFDLIIEGLEQDGIVKINGLGTFKITDVASRGSVNVNTGKKIEIKGHKKLTFIPADALKDQVNQPFAMFEPVEVDDTYQPDSSDATETEDTVELVEDVNVTDGVIENSVDTQTETEETVVADNFVEENATPEVNNEEPVTEIVSAEAGEEVDAAEATINIEEEKDETQAGEVESEPIVVQERPSEPVVVRVPKKEKGAEKATAPLKTKKRYRSFWVFAIAGFLVGAIAVNLMKRNHVSDVVADTVKVDSQPVQTAIAEAKSEPVMSYNDEVVVATGQNAVNDSVIPAIEVSDSQPTTVEDVAVTKTEEADEVYVFEVVDELASLNLKDITVADTLLYVADGEICRHTVAPDETLTKIAKRYFFDKKLWPYIVKYNNMDRPDELCRGMQIAIPRLIPRK